MNDKFDKLQQSLTANLPEPKEEKLPAVQQNVQITDNDVKDDYEYSRETYRNLIDSSSEALNGMMQLAADSEHPRAYEVLSTMVKNIADVTDKLMDLQKKKTDLTGAKPAQENAGGVTNNNVFVGSTTDLQRMLLDGNVIEPEE